MPHKVALVTGASSGIGAATAIKLKLLGYTVYAAARRTDRMAGLADAGIEVRALDVTDDASMVALMDTIIAASGRIDILVNNAGYGSYGALEDVPISEARRQVEVNLFGLARMTQLALPHMRAQHAGYIVNVSSVGGKIWTPLGSWYHATKFAVEGLSDSVRLETKKFGIKVVVIEPGSIATEWSEISAETLDAASSGGAYASLAKSVSAFFRSTTRKKSDPSVVADIIATAVTSARPKTRYAVGQNATRILMARKLLSDRAVDSQTMKSFTSGDHT
jgi:NAD(P)-dependent dehydrogenase (short-subunit alcohol dehydrogenase family)